MPTGLITLPLRLGIRSASIALGVTERAVGFAWHTVEAVVPGLGGHGATAAPERPFPREQEAERKENGGAPDRAADEIPVDPRADFEREDPRVPLREAPPEPEVRSEEPPPAPPAPPVAEEHVDTETTLVESFAEPGAEDGAGAQIHIEPPWAGYPGQSADEIVSRLDQCTAAELAAAELYEAAHKQRSTVLAAVERELKTRTSSASS